MYHEYVADFVWLWMTRDVNADSETMRRQVLGDPNLMTQLRQVSPRLCTHDEIVPTEYPWWIRTNRNSQRQQSTTLLVSVNSCPR